MTFNMLSFPPNEGKSIRYAESDIKFVKLPYFEITHTILKPVYLIQRRILNEELYEADFTFTIPPDVQADLDKAVTLPCYEIQMRVFKVAADGLDQPCSDCFPPKFNASVDGSLVTLPDYIKELDNEGREIDTETRPPAPVDITTLCAPGQTNHLKVQWKDYDEDVDYVLGISCAWHVDAVTLYGELLLKPRAYSEQMVIQAFNPKGDEPKLDSLKISFLCPLSSLRIKTPARFKQCSHFQCFDLQNFLKLYEKKLRWKCPICCQIFYSSDELIIDDYFAKKMSEFDESIKCVEISLQIQWKPMEGTSTAKSSTKPNPDQINSIKKESVEMEDPNSCRTSVDPSVYPESVVIDSAEEDELLKEPSNVDTSINNEVSPESEGTLLNPKTPNIQNKTQTDLHRHLKPLSKINVPSVKVSPRSSSTTQRPAKTKALAVIAQRAREDPERLKPNTPRKNGSTQKKGQDAVLVIDVELETASTSVKPSMPIKQDPLCAPVIQSRTPTPTATSRSTRKRQISGPSTTDASCPKAPKLVDATQASNVQQTRSKSVTKSPNNSKATTPSSITSISPVTSSGQKPGTQCTWNQHRGRNQKPKNEEPKEVNPSFNVKTFVNPDPIGANRERRFRGLPDYHDWSSVQKELEGYLKKMDNKVVDGPQLDTLLKDLNKKIYDGKPEISAESLKLCLRRKASGRCYWANKTLICSIDFAVTKDPSTIDMNKLNYEVQKKYEELFPEGGRKISKEEIQKRIEISKREAKINWKDEKFEEIFIRHHQNLVMMNTSGAALGMPLFVTLGELYFDLRNEIDKLVGFEISDSIFDRARESDAFQLSAKRYRGSSEALRRDVFERKLCMKID